MRFRKIIAALLVLAVGLTAGVVALLASPLGPGLVARVLIWQVSEPTEGRLVHIEGIEGQVFGELRLAELTYTVHGETRLIAKHIAINWSIVQLLKSTFQAKTVGIGELRFHPGANEDDDTSSAESLLPRLPLDLDLAEIDIARLGIINSAETYRLSGSLVYRRGGGIDTDLRLVPAGQGLETATLAASYDPGSMSLTVSLKAQSMPGGVLGESLFAGIASPVTLSLAGSGAVKHWRGQMRMDLPGHEMLSSSLATQISGDRLVLHLEGRANPQKLDLPDTLRELFKQVSFIGDIDFDGNLPERYELNLHTDVVNVSLEGSLETLSDLRSPRFSIALSRIPAAWLPDKLTIGALHLDGDLAETNSAMKIETDLRVENLAYDNIRMNSASGRALLDLNIPSSTWQISANGQLSLAVLSNEVLPERGSWAIQARLSAAERQIYLDQLDIRLGASHVTARGELLYAPVRLTGSLRAGLDVSLLSAAGLEDLFGGAVQLSLTAEHSPERQILEGELHASSIETQWRAVILTQPETAFRITSPQTVFRGTSIDDTDIVLTFAEGKIHWQASARLGNLPLQFAGWYGTEPGSRPALNDLVLDWAGMRIGGSLQLGPGGRPDGMLTAVARNSPALGLLFGQSLALSGTGKFVFENVVRATRLKTQIAVSDIHFTAAGDRHVSVGSLSMSADAAWNTTVVLHSAEMEAVDIRYGASAISAANLNMQAAGQHLNVSLLLAGNPQTDINLVLTGELDTPAVLKSKQLRVTSLTGHIRQQTLALVAPAEVHFQNDKILLHPLHLQIGDGWVQGELERTREHLKILVSISDLDGGILSHLLAVSEVRGSISAEADLRLAGQLAGSFSLSLHDLLFPDDPKMKKLSFAATGKIDSNIATINATASEQGNEMLRFDAHFPLSGNYRLGIGFDRHAPVSANIRGRFPLGLLWSTLGFYEHLFSGTLVLDLSLKGTLAAPIQTGTLLVEEFTYRHLLYRTYMSAAKLAIGIQGDRLVVDDITLSDGSGGTMRLTGWVVPFSDGGVTAELKTTMKDMRLLRRPDLSGRATGFLSYKQGAKQGHAAIDLVLGRAEIRLTNRTPPEYVALDVFEVNQPSQPDMVAAPARSSYPIALSGRIQADNRVFVRGRGLESEWRGDIQLDGLLSEPRLVGDLTLLAGIFSFAGHEFDLEKSSLTFRGEKPVDPEIAGRASHRSGDILAIATLSGKLSKPALTLTSQPSLPTDEILSRILFGTSKDHLSALQAAQLGLAVASLSGGGSSGFDITGRIRRILSLDRLEIGSPQAEGRSGPLIRGGRYLTNNIFVDVGTEPGEEDQSSARVEVGVTDNIAVGSKVTTTGTTRIGVRWKKDY